MQLLSSVLNACPLVSTKDSHSAFAKSHREAKPLGVHQYERSPGPQRNFKNGPRSLNTEEQRLRCPVPCAPSSLGSCQRQEDEEGKREMLFPKYEGSQEATRKRFGFLLTNSGSGETEGLKCVGFKLHSRSVSCIIYIHLRKVLCK